MSDVEDNIEETPHRESKKAEFFKDVDCSPKENGKKTKAKPKREVIMTWGKYKGKLVKDVLEFDEKYASWIYRQEFVKKFEDIYKILDDYFSELPPEITVKKNKK